MNSPLVSVVIIFFNAEKYLVEAIDSVLEQTYQNWELVLVDDGSQDGSPQLARDASFRHPEKIRYLQHVGHQNLGMSASRNAGIHAAKGEFIALLDSDDVWFPKKLDEQVILMQSNPEAAMVYGNHQFWKSWNGKSENSDYVMEPGVPVDRIFYPPELMVLYYSAKKAASAIPSDVLFKRQTALAAGGFEESFRGMFEDQIFMMKIFFQAPVFVSGSCWTRYRQHSESCVAKWQRSSSKGGALKLMEWSENYMLENKIANPEVWKSLHGVKFRLQHPLLHRTAERIKWHFNRLRT
jgi:glycosyltransferase involved in cell wall biosynthesis